MNKPDFSINPVSSSRVEFSEGLRARLSDMGFKAKTFEDFIVELASKSGAQLQSKVETLEKKVGEISTKNIPAGAKTFGLSSKSVDAVKLTTRAVDYTVLDKDFIYDFRDLKNNLPTGYAFLSGGVSVIDANGKKNSARGNTQSLRIEAFPATANVSASIKSPSGGIMELERTLVLNGNVDTSAVMNLKDNSGADADLSLSDHLELLSSAVVQLQQR